jgi:hypothetical protein
MIHFSKSAGGQTLHAVVVVAFDATTGQVHGTFVHGSLNGPDPEGLARSREHLLRDLSGHQASKAKLHTLEIPLSEMPDGSIDRVDVATRKLFTRSSALAGFRP